MFILSLSVEITFCVFVLCIYVFVLYCITLNCFTTAFTQLCFAFWLQECKQKSLLMSLTNTKLYWTCTLCCLLRRKLRFIF